MTDPTFDAKVKTYLKENLKVNFSVDKHNETVQLVVAIELEGEKITQGKVTFRIDHL